MPGDSGEVLPAVLAAVGRRPCLFWLDAHQMVGGVRGERVTPVLRELRHVLERRPGDVVLVDDARLFTGAFDYPTLDQVAELAAAARPGWNLEVADDIVRLIPNDSPAFAQAQSLKACLR